MYEHSSFIAVFIAVFLQTDIGKFTSRLTVDLTCLVKRCDYYCWVTVTFITMQVNAFTQLNNLISAGWIGNGSVTFVDACRLAAH